MAELFGYELKKKTAAKAQSFVAPSDEEGTLDIAGTTGFFSQYVNVDKSAKNDWDLIRKYRQTAENPECDMAIEDIVNETITADEDDTSVKINLDYVDASPAIKKKMFDEFDELLRLLDWKDRGHYIFKRWYIDGRIFYHKMVDKAAVRKGIAEIRYIDPKFIKKVRMVEKTMDKKGGATAQSEVDLVKTVQEFYIYNETGAYPTMQGSGQGPGAMNSQGVKVTADSITYVTSGIFNPTTKQVYGHLHKAIRPVNQLRMMEDSLVIYRVARAPERRIFYIDVGNLPKPKAEQYLKDVMARYRNKVVYDASSGEIKDDRNHQSMLEDFWLPRREGGRGTEITTLPAGQNLGEMDDVEYFKQKVWRSLNIPISRLQSDTGFNMGRSAEIQRDEVKFNKFVQRLRKKFSAVFQDILKTQLILKGIVTPDDWDLWKEYVIYDFNDDNYFFELKDAEIFTNRINSLQVVTEYIGTYFSKEWIRKQVLHQTEDEIETIDKQIEAEKADGEVDPMAGTNMGGPDSGFGNPEYELGDDDDDVETPTPNGNGANGQSRPEDR